MGPDRHDDMAYHIGGYLLVVFLLLDQLCLQVFFHPRSEPRKERRLARKWQPEMCAEAAAACVEAADGDGISCYVASLHMETS